MKNKHYRQGDVLVIAVSEVKAPARTEKRIILAYGEVTGHAHEVELTKTVEVEAFGFDEEVDFIAVRCGPAVILHQEHGRIELPTGTYETIRQTEFSPSRDLVRVAD